MRGDRFERAADRPPVGMIGERGRPPGAAGDIEFGFVLSRCSDDTICARMRSTASASKRGSFSASRSRSKASSWFSLSVRSVPRTYSRLARICSSIALRSMRAWKALPSRSPAPSSSSRDRHVGEPGLSSGSCVGAAAEREFDRDQRHGAVAHEPGFDAAGADDALDLGRARRHAERDQRCDDERHHAQPGDDGMGEPLHGVLVDHERSSFDPAGP